MKYMILIGFMISCSNQSNSLIDSSGQEINKSLLIEDSIVDSGLDGNINCREEFNVCDKPCFYLESKSFDRQMCFDKCVVSYKICVNCPIK